MFSVFVLLLSLSDNTACQSKAFERLNLDFMKAKDSVSLKHVVKSACYGNNKTLKKKRQHIAHYNGLHMTCSVR